MLWTLFIACGLSTFDAELSAQAPRPEAGQDSGDSGLRDSGLRDTGDWEDQDTGSRDTGSGSTPGSSYQNPRAPGAGEVIVAELMINPAAVLDDAGEYVELLNLSERWLSLQGCSLADEDVDESLLVATAGLVFGPGERLVICAQESANGGVSCDGVIDPKSTGGGFVLANSGDEVLLLGEGGQLLDRVAYTSGFSEVGAALGLDPGKHSGGSVEANWCPQGSSLTGGDLGTPGERNDPC